MLLQRLKDGWLIWFGAVLALWAVLVLGGISQMG